MESAKCRITVTKPSLPPLDEYEKELESIWSSKWVTNMGPKHLELEEKLKDYMGVESVTLFVNGHLALENAISSFDFTSGSEIITTPFSFPSTTHAIVRNNLKPVFCDIKINDYTIDEEKIESLITEKTCAILPVHVYGNICNVDAIKRIADNYNLKVIYDAAHAFGEQYEGVGVGQFGDASMFSFHATKVFNTIEGGCVTTSNKSITHKLNLLKNFGIEGTESVNYIGGNGKMNEFSAAMGICNLRHINENIAIRKKIQNRYIETLGKIKGLYFQKGNSNQTHNYAYMPVLFDPEESGVDRDKIYQSLLDHGIASRKYFYPLINDCACYKKDYNSNNTPVAKYVSNNILTLPIYPDLSLTDVDMICKIIMEEIQYANS